MAYFPSITFKVLHMNPATISLTKDITEAVMTATHPENLVSIDQTSSLLDTVTNYASTLTVSDGTTMAIIVAVLIVIRQVWKKFTSK